MDYEQKYKELVERLKQAKETNGGYTFCSVLDDIIPELKESEDERIKETIIRMLYVHDENSYHFDYISKEKCLAWLEKQSEQKPAEWSEEDEYFQYVLINECVGKTDKGNAINWLKSLKDRVHPKQEWSEEDNEIIEALNSYVNDLDLLFKRIKIGDKDVLASEFREKVQSWLKSLRPQNRWKPSEEQISVLNTVINYSANSEKPYWHDFIYNVLKDLKEQLKNLFVDINMQSERSRNNETDRQIRFSSGNREKN